MPPTRIDFENELNKQLNDAKNKGRKFEIIISRDLHEAVGGYPSSNHRMKTCCDVMRNRMDINDIILKQPRKGDGATLEIKYMI